MSWDDPQDYRRGWWRTPARSRLKIDATGGFRCVFRAVGTPAGAAEVARVTLIDQRFVEIEIDRL